MPKVFVTDAEQGRIPLSITRSLGRKKIQVYNGGYLGITPVYFSRYCTKKVKYPFISARPGKFKKFIFKYLKENKFDVVFPVMNESVLFFSKHQEELSKYTKIPLVGYEKLIIAADKAKTMELAEKLRVPHPKTHYIYDKLELRQVANELAYPVIVKARRSYGSRGVKICRNKLHLKRAFRHISKLYGTPIIQEYIPEGGDAIGVSCLFDYNHREKAVFAHKRLRQYPIKGGPSTLRESIRHKEAEEIAVKVLKKLKWHGLAMLEFKIDPRDGKPKLLEINPRFWGSLALPIAAGVDFPYLLYKLVTEGKVEKIKDYKVGIKSRWLSGDFLYLLSTKNKLKFLPEFLKFGDKNTYYDDVAYDDPLPLLGRILSLIYAFDKKVMNKVFRNI